MNIVDISQRYAKVIFLILLTAIVEFMKLYFSFSQFISK